MNQNERFNDILNECLDRILKGEAVEQCLRSYPEQAKELEPLLRTAIAAKVASTIQPRPEFRAKARYEFRTALRDMEAKKSRRSFFSWRWQWQPGWAIAIVVVIVVVLAGGGTVAAASNSMPDSALYPVKLASEQVQLAVTPSEIGKTELNAQFADRRAEEIAYVASKGDTQEVQIIAQRLNTNLDNITNLVGNEANTSGGSLNGPMSSAESTPTAENGQQPMLGIAAAPETPAPATTAAPAPPAALAPAPAPAVVPPAANSPATTNPADKSLRNNPEAGQSSKANNVDVNRREKLKQIIIENFNIRQTRLEEALNNASPRVRPAVRLAIAQSIDAYEKTLKYLEQAENGN